MACFGLYVDMSMSSDSSGKKAPGSERAVEVRASLSGPHPSSPDTLPRNSLSRGHHRDDLYNTHHVSSSSSTQRQPQRSPTLPLSVARQLHHNHGGHGKEEPSSSESPSPDRVGMAAGGSVYHHAGGGGGGGGKKRNGETGRERGRDMYDSHQPKFLRSRSEHFLSYSLVIDV